MFNSDLDSPDHLTSIVQYPTISVQTNPTSGHGSLRKGSKFTNDDIPGPKGTKSTWMQIFLPMWFEYLGTLDDPWDNTDLLDTAQQTWDDVFPHNPQVLHHKKEPIQ